VAFFFILSVFESTNKKSEKWIAVMKIECGCDLVQLARLESNHENKH